MNKIFLILVLLVSIYGHSYPLFGYGASDCSEYLDAYDKGTDTIDFLPYATFAQGVFLTLNSLSEADLKIEILDKKQFNPRYSVIGRTIKKYCEENLAEKFHPAVVGTWLENAK